MADSAPPARSGRPDYARIARTLTTPDEIRADDASSCCGEIGSEIIEIASLAGKPMNADYRGARLGRAPIYVR